MAAVRTKKRRTERKAPVRTMLGAGVRADRRLGTPRQEGASSGLARNINRDLILELLRREQPVARVDLARLSGLQRSTVSLIVEDLKREQWVTEGSTIKTSRGRPPTLLTLNDNVVIIAVDIHPTEAILSLMDLNGRFLSRELIPVGNDPEATLQAFIESMKSLRATYPTRMFEGIGVSMPGRVGPESQRLLFAPNLHWGHFDLKSGLEKAMQLQVEMDNAANACLLSELWYGKLTDVRNAVVVTVSEGIGCGILANGELLLGSNGLAGEFGHICIDPTGPRCGCTQDGCWEMFASCRATLLFFSESQQTHTVSTMQDLARLANAGDSHAITAIERQARFLAVGLRLVTAAISPELIIFAGELHSCWTRLAPMIEAELQQRLLAGSMPKILSIGDGELARLRGAAALILKRHSGYNRSPSYASNVTLTARGGVPLQAK